MKTLSKRFEMAYNALVHAFFEGTLAKYDCACCAVGNIVGAANNCRIDRKGLSTLITWHNAPLNLKTDEEIFNSRKHIPNAAEVWSMWETVGQEKPHTKKYLSSIVANTGYTGKELMKVEQAFENNTNIRLQNYLRHTEQELLEDQYRGLCAVVDVLLALENEAPNEALKAKFREHPALN